MKIHVHSCHIRSQGHIINTTCFIDKPLIYTPKMATGNISTLSVIGSEETFDTCCSPCTEYGRTNEAMAFCVDCGSNFCEACLRDHNKFAALRSHQIVDKSRNGEQNVTDGAKTTLSTERCAVHHGNVIDTYCQDHDDVCCETCTAVKHR